MKITLNWLRQYVHFDWSPDELAQRLTLLGLEVEAMQKAGGELDGVVVAQVLTRDKHPNADKLSLCRVHDGHGERQIVCGAQNFKAGDKVPLILPGYSLPAKAGEPPADHQGRQNSRRANRMACCARPSNWACPAGGGRAFDSARRRQGRAAVRRISSAAPAGDVVYDLEVTPNRPDWNSVVGIAREISALTGNPLRLPEIQFPPAQLSAEPIADFVSVRIEDPELCPRYNARLLRGVKIGPSPDWMRSPPRKSRPARHQQRR